MFNHVTLIGYLGSDAESRTTRNNSRLTVLSLATKRTWKNRATGERESQTTWHKCVAFRRTAEYAAGLTKGAHRLSIKRTIENWRKREDSALRAGIFKA